MGFAQQCGLVGSVQTCVFRGWGAGEGEPFPCISNGEAFKSKRLKSRLCGFNEMPKTEVLTGSLVSSNNRILIWDVADS